MSVRRSVSVRGRFGLAAMCLGLSMLAGCSQSTGNDAMTASGAWIRYVPDGNEDGVAAAYVTLHNKQVVDDRLVGASVEGASRVALRRVEGEGEDARAAALDPGPVIDARNYLRLQPGGVHLALYGMTPSANTQVPVTLHFLHAPDLEVDFATRPTAGHVPASNGADLRP